MSENADQVRGPDSPATEPDSEPIAAHGEDLADGTTHGVEPGGTERDRSPNTRSADELPGVGIGGATSGEPHHEGYEVDPVVPPGRRSSPQGSDADSDS